MIHIDKFYFTALSISLISTLSAPANAIEILEKTEAASIETVTQQLQSQTTKINFTDTSLNQIQIKFSDVDNPSVSIELISPASKTERISRLKRELTIEFEKNNIVSIGTRLLSYSCRLETMKFFEHKKVNVAGACYGEIIVNLPNKSLVSVTKNGIELNTLLINSQIIDGKRIVHSASSQRQAALILKVLEKESFDKNRLQILKNALQMNPETVFSPKNAQAAVDLMSFRDGKVEVAILVGARVPKAQRLEFFTLIQDDLFNSDKEKVSSALSGIP